MISRNNTYEIDKVRRCIFVYALMKLIQYNYDDYIIFFLRMRWMRWVDMMRLLWFML